jgi:hypothetical protein
MDTGKPCRWAVAVWALLVFALAVCLRVPSCYESFWLDELHTAWAIWGDFGEVAQRAEVGNQTPLYFQLMWVWKQLVGESEVALRLSSVLAVSLAAALLVIAVSHSTRRLAGGVIAGTVLAVESNAIFFGTELRPYAWVMLLAVVATWMAMELIRARSSYRPEVARLVLVVAICFAVLLHPTAVVTLAVLAAALLFLQMLAWRFTTDQRWQFRRLDLISITVCIASLIVLSQSSLSDSWENRGNWRVFGRAGSPWQMWRIWPWTSIAAAPLALGAITAWRKPSREFVTACLPLLVALTATAVFFVASYFDWVPLWHRRYFIAALPMLAWSAGAIPVVGLPDRLTWQGTAVACLFAFVIVGFLSRQQGTIALIRAGKLQLAVRGEDWRGAIAYVRQRHIRHDELNGFPGTNSIWLDTDLIEARILEYGGEGDLVRYEGDSKLEEGRVLALAYQYFRFPVEGPYQLAAEVTATTPRARNSVWYDRDFIHSTLSQHRAGDALWIISRGRSKATLQKWCDSIWITQLSQPEYRRFGRIWVVKIPEPPVEQIRTWLENNKTSG